jgi:RNA polymerase sigma-70 factor (ECF subfamily)
MNGCENPAEALIVCETIVRNYIAQGEFSLAVGVLVSHYQDAMLSYCTYHLLDQEVAREVAQEIFLAAFESMPRFRGTSSVKTWLYSIALNKCLEAGRTRTRREAIVRSHEEDIGQKVHCDPPGQPEEIFSQETRRRLVWHALRRLRIYERELLVLRYLEELTYDEIASILHVSRRTVERHLPRAEAKFHRAYERCQAYAVPSRQPTRGSTPYPSLIPLVQDAGSS